MGKRVLVITGGEAGGTISAAASEAPYDLVIAADGGLDRARALGIRPDVVIGDLDSASNEALDEARRDGTVIDAHPTEKDHTDLELALNRAMEEEASEIRVIGGSGGRPDHWFTNLALLAAAARGGVEVTADMGGWFLSVLVPARPFSADCRPGQLVSLLPVGGDAGGVTTEGLVYPLRGEDLPAGTSRGVSNLTCGGPVRVEIRDGALLVMTPNRDEESR